MAPDNRSEFHRLFVENQRRLFGFVLTLLPRIDEAEEVFQSICVVLLGKFDAFEPGTSFIRWACQIAKYEVLNYRRRTRRDHLVFTENEVELLAERRLELEPEIDSRRTALRLCLQKLRPKDRRLVQARYAGNCNAQSRGGTAAHAGKHGLQGVAAHSPARCGGASTPPSREERGE